MKKIRYSWSGEKDSAMALLLLLSVLLCPNLAFAQTIKIAKGVDQSCFTLNNSDMKSYQIIYKEHGKDIFNYSNNGIINPLHFYDYNLTERK